MNVNAMQQTGVEGADPRWKDMYRIGGIASVTSVALIFFGVVAFLLWPYTPGYAGAEKIFAQLQSDPIGGLMALDFLYLVSNIVAITTFLALYAALKRVNESYAFLALALGLIAFVLLAQSRPIAEMFRLSALHAAASSGAEQGRFLAAGEALLELFNGTSYILSSLFGMLSLLISALLMLRGGGFGKPAAYVGIVTNAAALLFFLPFGIGKALLFLSLIGYVVWNVQMAAVFFRLHRAAERL